MAMLSDALMRDRVKARFDLLAYLDSKRYNDFKRDFAAFMTDEPHDWNRTLRIRDRLGSIIWQRYEDLRAHIDMVRTIDTNNLDSESEATLHETRIVGKRLRYALEVFEDVFDNQTKQSLKPLKQLQEHLGTLQDIAVVRAYIAQLDVAESARPAIDAYLASRMEERARLLHELPEHWEYILGEDYRRTLADVLIWL
jgi:CHAD domain-containing protein